MDYQRQGHFEDSPLEEEVSLQDYIRILYRGRWIIIVSLVIISAATIYLTFTAPPQYESSVLIMLAGKAEQASMIFQNPVMPQNYLKVNNEIEVIRSRYLARRVIKALRYADFSDSLYILGNKQYGDQRPQLRPALASIKNKVMGLLTGATEPVASVADTLNRQLACKLLGGMQVEPIRDTEAIRLTVTSVDAAEAALLANTIAREYRLLDREYSLTDVVEVKNFLEDQIAKIQRDLTISEEALQHYQEQEGVFGLDETAQTLIDQLSTFEATYYGSKAELEVTQRELENQEKEMNAREKWAIDESMNTTNPLIFQLRQAIAELEARKIAAMTSQGYDEGSEGIQELNSRIDDFKGRLYEESHKLTNMGLSPEEQSEISLDLMKKVLNNRISVMALSAKARAYKKLVDQYADKLEQLPEKSIQYARLDRERQVNEKYYMLLKTKYQEARIKEASQISSIRIVDPAIPPESPVKPRKKLNLLLGIFLGLGLGVGITFLREYFDHSIRDIEDLKKYGLATLVIVPDINTKLAIEKVPHENGMPATEYSLKERLVTHYDPKSSVAEAYRSLRTQIQYLNPDQPIRSLVISSPGPGDGKSTTIVNLGITFSNLGKRVLLIDADLRKPVQHRVFDIAPNPGLTDWVRDDLSQQEIVRETGIDNLFVITCGDIPPNPSEILASRKLHTFIEQLKAEFDLILLDSPPIIAVTDASILAKLTDAIFMVVRAESTDERILKRSIEQLSQINCNLAGAILNDVNVTKGYSSYYYYHQYYHYNKDGKPKQRRLSKKRPGKRAWISRFK